MPQEDARMRPAAIVFDLFGTLLDISSLRTAAAAFSDDPAAFVATWREKQIGYAFAATMMGRYEDFDALTARGLDYAARRHARAYADREWETLASAWCDVAPYADAAPALAELRASELPLAVLTNGTMATAVAAMTTARIDAAIDVTLSVEAVRVYKPDPRVYALATTHFNAPAERLIFVTSNSWDATGAAEFGMTVAWCNRLGAPAETFGVPPAWTIADLRALPDIVNSLR